MEYQREPTEIHVSAASVDFTSAAQVRAFHDRLARAARQACDSDIPGDPNIAEADAMCAHESLDRAVAGLHQPMLTALHTGAKAQPAKVELARAGR